MQNDEEHIWHSPSLTVFSSVLDVLPFLVFFCIVVFTVLCRWVWKNEYYAIHYV